MTTVIQPSVSTSPKPLLNYLNSHFETLHTVKEDAFWYSYMGLGDDSKTARADLDKHDKALQGFLQDPKNLEIVNIALGQLNVKEDDTFIALKGWQRTFTAHSIASQKAPDFAAKIIAEEGELAQARGAMKLGYTDKQGKFVAASSVKLSGMLRSDPDSELRKAAWQGLQNIEHCVLDNGFLELVKSRNKLARMLGGSNYYDWTVRRVEGLSCAEIFVLLDELEVLTRDSAQQFITTLAAVENSKTVDPWSIQYLISGDITAEQDPYFPFSEAIARWGHSFANLGITYNNATLVLDLLDRKGKYENGFMHGPAPAWRNNGVPRAARIQFTANAIVGMVGSGRRATETLFHEGGHAAHFANIDMPAPCFAQEFAPTSVAFAETQSMFLDSLLGDADWQRRYAKNLAGESIPMSLIERSIDKKQPSASWGLRAMLTVPYAERAIYEMSDAELNKDNVLKRLREIEAKLLFLPQGSQRPVLSIPHLLSGESSAYYHGYVLADMAVQQTRHFFIERDGHLVDNNKIGATLKEHYWQPGNSKSFLAFIKGLTGEKLSAKPLAAWVNRSANTAISQAREAVDKLDSIPQSVAVKDVDLHAQLQIVDGNETVCGGSNQTSNQNSQKVSANKFIDHATAFSKWIKSRE